MARSFKPVIEFANFICHFGNAELLDFLEEIVLPAFLNPRTRQYGKSSYFLHDVSLTTIRSGRASHPAIVGRIVVDTQLERQQVFRDGRLVESYRALDTAPSSIFALLLDNHKLLYAREVAGGPGLAAFRTTMEWLLRYQRAVYLEGIYRAARESHEKGSGPRVSRAVVNDSIPAPDLEVVPLMGGETLIAFLKRFSVLKEFHIKVLKPNHEVDNSGLFDDILRARELVEAESTTLVHRNKSGLQKTQAAKQAAPAITGNAEVKFVGLGQNNEALSGSNDDLKVTAPTDGLPTDPKVAGRTMLSRFKSFLDSGLLKIADGGPNETNSAKLRTLIPRD